MDRLAGGTRPDARAALDALAVFLPDLAAVPRIRAAACLANLEPELDTALSALDG